MPESTAVVAAVTVAACACVGVFIYWNGRAQKLFRFPDDKRADWLAAKKTVHRWKPDKLRQFNEMHLGEAHSDSAEELLANAKYVIDAYLEAHPETPFSRNQTPPGSTDCNTEQPSDEEPRVVFSYRTADVKFMEKMRKWLNDNGLVSCTRLGLTVHFYRYQNI